MADLLGCTVMPYAWGSRTAIAELQGRAAAAGPEAELWMGAHPVAPSKIGAESLAARIAASPDACLGAAVAGAFGPRLPFLLKVIAAAEPLSIQAHPTAEQARAGWDDEERRGVPRGAPHRNYKDSSHKPELVCALTPFDALCGFRRIDDTLRILASIDDVPALAEAARPLRERRDLASTFRAIMELSKDAVNAVVDACARRASSDETAIVPRLAAKYPGDVGVVSALLLNHLTLAPGEAIYLGAGNLHAYLRGTAVEIMASSDNVLRGGLTPKHVDVPELEKVVVFADGPIAPARPRAVDAHEKVYEAPAREFRLSVITLAGGDVVTREVAGPEILFVASGRATVTDASGAVDLARGSAAFVPASSPSFRLTGEATVYRAAVNL